MYSLVASMSHASNAKIVREFKLDLTNQKSTKTIKYLYRISYFIFFILLGLNGNKSNYIYSCFYNF